MSEESDRKRRRDRRDSTGGSAASGTKKYKSRDREAPAYDDSEGHYVIRHGSYLHEDKHYEIVKQLGEGTFGKVVECIDKRTGKHVAVKVIKGIPKYRDAAKIELQVLQKLTRKDPNGDNHCIRLLDWFDFRGHICMVFELLGQSLYDFMKDVLKFEAFPSMTALRRLAHQIVSAVAFTHKNLMTHTDLKPENILLTSKVNTRDRDVRGMLQNMGVCVIDFGSATFDWDHHTTVVSTRHYRAPEVILETGWSHPCDIWSIGCILMELYSGVTLFQTHDNMEHLAMMEKLLGPFPPHLLLESTKRYGDTRGHLRWPEKARNDESIDYVEKNCQPLMTYLRHGHTALDLKFFDMIKKMLNYIPEDRITAREALEHSFFSDMPSAAHADASDEGLAAEGGAQGKGKRAASEPLAANGCTYDIEGLAREDGPAMGEF